MQKTATTNTINLTDQTTEIAQSFYGWLRNDSLEALIAIGVGVGLFLLLRLLRGMGCRLLEKREDPAAWRSVVARVARRTHSFFLAALAADIVTNVVAPPGGLLTAVDFIFTVSAVIQGAIWVRELVLVAIAHRAEQGDADHSALANAMGVIRILVNIVVWAIALILVLDNLGVNVTGLVAGLGIGGIAIGLAAQGIFSDLFAALSIIFDRPFRRGDTIQYGTTTARVEAIGMKTTRLRAVSGEQVVMANTKLLEQEVRNLRLIDERRVLLILPLQPNTEADKLAQVPDLLRAVVEAQPSTRFEHAVVIGMNGNSIDVELMFFMTDPPAEIMAQTRHRVLLDTIRTLHGVGIEFSDLTPPRG
ncbi:mechanosensitive ion channel family protein [Sphingoaurantiacus capsulatus]|uniref:Mechanosensitive ion channel family protein n=1 Tax=Sphingoaurantiacus capsulatus TaxID=1771310 RepID=A0ABV7XDG1_9SPHN